MAAGKEVTRSDEPIRVLTAKVGLDGHDRGVKVVSRALRDAGMEVVYSGLHRTPEEIVATAIEEDVDVIGLSILSGAHMTLLPRILELLRDREVLDRFIVVGGGVIPDDDVPLLKGMGVRDILGQDTAPDAVAARIRELVADRGPRD
jgi:2-hydroxyisobutanoyl-CoA mutase small subunit